MAEDEQEEPRRPRRPRRNAATGTRRPPRDADPERNGADAHEPDDGEADAEPDGREKAGRVIPAQVAARRAVQHVTDFTGRPAENVVSIDRADGGWQVGVEVVETQRIPDTQDVLAIYEVCVDRGGHLLSYKRTRRYARGQLDGKC